jgi:hypothetical protein
MRRIIYDCDLQDSDVKKLTENKIDGKNIIYLTGEDLKNIGLGIGPAR